MRVHTHTPHDECFLILLASPLFGSSPRIHSPLTHPTPRTHDTPTDQLHPTSYHVRPPARSVRAPACLRCCCVWAPRPPGWAGRIGWVGVLDRGTEAQGPWDLGAVGARERRIERPAATTIPPPHLMPGSAAGRGGVVGLCVG